MPANNLAGGPVSEIQNGDHCLVAKGAHVGKSGTVQDRNVSKTGHVTSPSNRLTVRGSKRLRETCPNAFRQTTTTLGERECLLGGKPTLANDGKAMQYKR